MKKETQFQHELIKEISERIPGVIVMKLDSGYLQGVPDLLVLSGDKWATLECKRDKEARHRPNQDHYVDLMNTMSFSRFVFPENKEQVMEEMVRYFG